MDQETLVNEQISVGAKVIAEFEKVRPVKIAFWLKEPDQAFWYLYLVCDGIAPATLRDAYGEVATLPARIRDPNFNVMRINLLGPDDPLAIAAFNIYKRFPSDIPVRLQTDTFGGMGVDGVFVYPPRTAVAA